MNDVARTELVAGNLLDRFVEPRLVVRHIHRDRGRTAGHDAEHVAVVHELFRNLLEQIANPTGVVELQVQIVDEEQKNAP